MSVAKARSPIKVGVLFDLILPPNGYWDFKRDMLDAIRLTFDDAVARGILDRPIEIVFRECEGLPRGTVKTVIDTTRQLIEEDGCVIIIGPLVTENAKVLRGYVDREGHVPMLALVGTDDWLGEWTFALGNGSMPDEPYVLGSIMAQAGIRRVGVTVERSLIGRGYYSFFQQAAEAEGLVITGMQEISQTDANVDRALVSLRDGNPEALVHWGFGFGAIKINDSLAQMNWNPPRYMGTSWEDAFIDGDIQKAFIGWIGLEQYDEQNTIAQAFLDKFAKCYGRRPEYFTPGLGHDFANAVVHALADAHPLSPEGAKEGLERVKMLPAASGAEGTRISFGKWTRRGWMGASYLIAREFDPNDLTKTLIRGRIGTPRGMAEAKTA
jgi:ABC-type branched-subunit amino acid transport system substrate-binding protein